MHECIFKYFPSLVWNISEDAIWYVSNLFWEQHNSFTTRLHKTRYIQLLKVVKDLQPEWKNTFERFKSSILPILGLEIKVRSIPCEVKDNIENVDEEKSDHKSKIDSVEIYIQGFNRLSVPLAHHSHGSQIHLFLKFKVNQKKSGYWPMLNF